ncbi:hypothetical protein PSTG_12594 [Puccinia striiformis f. sp. tritici PST-78]|uniref:Uncharacterized protein n=1 Tax=Puccinia striiformis f. sp. tritici PST-78 TaxID=1165861 RepID=A0A0L0V457_9BASI|nr:hypothetical protein PSTG_12594 [Puccinia striiformis f. sp. tritici PST-78]
MALQQLHHTKTSWIPCFISQEQRNSKLMCQVWYLSQLGPSCLINGIIDHSHKRKTTGCASIKQPDNKRMTCEKRRIVNDDIFLNIDDQHRSISNLRVSAADLKTALTPQISTLGEF